MPVRSHYSAGIRQTRHAFHVLGFGVFLAGPMDGIVTGRASNKNLRFFPTSSQRASLRNPVMAKDAISATCRIGLSRSESVWTDDLSKIQEKNFISE